jgi:excisionase family DNA binding protein
MPTQSPPKSARRLAPISVAADYAAVSTKTIRRWISSGRVAGYRAGPRLIRVDLAELDAMLRPIPTAGGGSDAA